MSFGKSCFLFACLAFAACYRNAASRQESLEGVRFGAKADVVRGQIDLLRIRFTAKNESRHTRQIMFGNCGVRSAVEIAPPDRSRGRIWNFEKWQRSSPAAYASPLGLQDVCITSLTVILLEPGASTQVDQLSLPLQVIMSDSITPGRYQVRGKPGVLNYRGAMLNAGIVDLSAVTPIRTMLPTAISKSARGMLMGQVVDSITGLEVSRDNVEIVTSGVRTPNSYRGSFSAKAFPQVPLRGGDSVYVRRIGYFPVKLAVKLSPDSIYQTLILMRPDTIKIIATPASSGASSMSTLDRVPPIYIIDGQRVSPDASITDTSVLASWHPKISPDSIYEMNSLMADEAVVKYGEEARGGVQILTTWDYARRNGLIPPPMGPGDFTTGRLFRLRGGATIRILNVSVFVVRQSPRETTPPPVPPEVILTVVGGNSMSVHISTETAASATDKLKAESIEVLEFLAETVARANAERATIIICRNVPCAEQRGGVEETLTFVRKGAKWEFEPPPETW
jgi:hypothetical protein